MSTFFNIKLKNFLKKLLLNKWLMSSLVLPNLSPYMKRSLFSDAWLWREQVRHRVEIHKKKLLSLKIFVTVFEKWYIETNNKFLILKVVIIKLIDWFNIFDIL